MMMSTYNTLAEAKAAADAYNAKVGREAVTVRVDAFQVAVVRVEDLYR